MKVYLDNNVLVDIEAGKCPVESFLTIPNTDYYYSDAHLNELLEAKGNPKVSQDERLDLISRLCGCNYICSGAITTPEFLIKDCHQTYQLVDNPMRVFMNQATVVLAESLEKIRDMLGFDSRSFNNEPPGQVLRMIDERMKERLGIGLLAYLYQTEAYGRALYCTLLNIIDSANYWGDRKTDHSDIARFYDASHAYSAQICDVLVTSDKRMREKVKAIYAFLDIKTHVMDVDEFIKK